MADKTKAEWNAIGYIVKKGSTGVYSKGRKTILFSVYDTFINRSLAKKLLRQHQYYLKKRGREGRETISTTVNKKSTDDIPF